MALPDVPLPTGTVEIAGTAVPIKSLSRTAVVSLSDLDGDSRAAEVLIVSKGTGVTDDEARAWLDSVDADTAGTLLEAVAVLSGIRKPGAKPGEA